MAWDMEIIDLSDALPRVLGHKDMYKGWLDKFFIEASLSPVDEAFSIKNHDSAYNATHKIKGTASNLSIMKVYKIAESLEKKLKDNVAFDLLTDELEELRKEFWAAAKMYGENLDELTNYKYEA